MALNVQRAEEQLSDFVIPLAVDDLPSIEFNIELTRLNAIPFRDGWHGGLAHLLAKLERDGIAKRSSFGPPAKARLQASYSFTDARSSMTKSGKASRTR